MTSRTEMPLTGYAIERIYTNDLLLCDKPVPPDQPPDEGEIGFGWDWRIIDTERFEVRISVSVEPIQERDEFVRATIVGRFRRVAEKPSVALVEFARLQAPAILLPYARELITRLTGDSIYGPFFLPPVNVVGLMRDFPAEKATASAQLSALTQSVKAEVAKAPVRGSVRQRAKRKGKDSG